MNNAKFINGLDDTCKAILKEKYPVFSEAEYQRRFSLIETVIKQKKLDKNFDFISFQQENFKI